MARSKRILLAADAFSKSASGGLVARWVADVLRRHGHVVGVLDFNKAGTPPGEIPADLHYFRDPEPPRRLRETLFHRGASVFLPRVRPAWFNDLLAQFRPDVLHICALDATKPDHLIADAKQAGVRVVAQVFTYHFFCAQGYAYRDEKTPCWKCASGTYHAAIAHGCVSLKSGLARGFSGLFQRRSWRHIDAVLSTCEATDTILKACGVSPARLLRLPLPFDPSRVNQLPVHDGAEFVFHGQFRDFKGATLLSEIARKCPDAKFAVYPFLTGRETLESCGLGSTRPPNLRIELGVDWFAGVAERVASCRGVLVPSLWPNTTEYATLEGMGCRKPVVVFDAGAYQQILKDRVDAMVVPYGDTNAYAAAIRELDGNPALRSAVGARARVTFDALTSEGVLIETLEQAYSRPLP